MKIDRIYKLTVFVFVIAAIIVLFGGNYIATHYYKLLPDNFKEYKGVNQFTVIKSFLTALFFLGLANIFMLYNIINMLSELKTNQRKLEDKLS
ncbi:hypothetical protein KAJ27_00690 [bacterium]|nr:hypothetical protein [bacterium]